MSPINEEIRKRIITAFAVSDYAANPTDDFDVSISDGQWWVRQTSGPGKGQSWRVDTTTRSAAAVQLHAILSSKAPLEPQRERMNRLVERLMGPIR